MYFDDEYILKTVIQHIQDKEEEYDVWTWKDANKELTDNNGKLLIKTVISLSLQNTYINNAN